MRFIMDWQNYTALVIVTGAVLVLVKQAIAFVRAPTENGCGNCPSRGQSNGGCRSKGHTSHLNGLQLVQIDVHPAKK